MLVNCLASSRTEVTLELLALVRPGYVGGTWQCILQGLSFLGVVTFSDSNLPHTQLLMSIMLTRSGAQLSTEGLWKFYSKYLGKGEFFKDNLFPIAAIETIISGKRWWWQRRHFCMKSFLMIGSTEKPEKLWSIGEITDKWKIGHPQADLGYVSTKVQGQHSPLKHISAKFSS